MKIVEFIGGLGNQMFQFALLTALKRAFPEEEVKGDISQFEAYRLHNGYELDRIFGIRIGEASPEEIRRLRFVFPNYLFSRAYRRLPACFQKKTYCREALDMTWDPTVLTKKGDRYFSGYWQNERYFVQAAEDIRKAFAFSPFQDERNKALAAQLQAGDQTVGIHVRRGDYTRDPLFRDICTEDYFRNALALLPGGMKRYRYVIFSNDPAWCRSFFGSVLGEDKITLPDWNRGKESWRDMQLLSLCPRLILANSSFSWWAGWLDPRAQGRIMVPEKWLNAKLAVFPAPPDWIRVPIRAQRGV